MKIKIVRDVFRNKKTLGKMFINGKYECVTSEDVDRHLEHTPEAQVQSNTAIPRGTYKVSLRYSHYFNKTMPILNDVPNFTHVYIHAVDNSIDIDGCIQVGTSIINDNSVGQSIVAYNGIMSKIKKVWTNGEDVTITII